LKKSLTASLLKKGLSENPWQLLDLRILSPKYIGVINRRNASLFKKGLSEKVSMFEFKNLIPKPYRRDKPAQRFWHNPF